MHDVIRHLRRIYVGSGLRRLLPHWLKTIVRRRWVRLARRIGYPVSSPQFPRPRLDARRRRMRLTHVLVSCDLNPAYLGFWPLVERAWSEIVGLEPVLVLIAQPQDVPQELESDRVIPFAPVPDVHTAFQAQCIRLLYPAVLPADGAVLISDIDLLPVDPAYFHAPVASLDERSFVIYRDALMPRGEVSMAYDAARPETWGEIFDVRSVEDVRERLAQWGAAFPYEGVRGGGGWYTDQRLLHRALLDWHERTGRLWVLDDDICGYRRLGRHELERAGVVTNAQRRGLLRRKYSDSDWRIPYAEFKEQNDALYELALAAAGLARRPAGVRLPIWKSGRSSTPRPWH